LYQGTAFSRAASRRTRGFSLAKAQLSEQPYGTTKAVP